MADTDDLEEYWKDIRPGRQPEKPRAVVSEWPILDNLPSSGILKGYLYLGFGTPTAPRFTWSWE